MTDVADPTLVRRHLAALHSDRDRLAALAGTSLDHEVAPCPGWTSRDLLVHLGRVHRWAERALAIAPGADLPRFGPGPGDRDPLEWVVEGRASWENRPSGWPATRYEQKARTVYGHEVWYFRFRRR